VRLRYVIHDELRRIVAAEDVRALATVPGLARTDSRIARGLDGTKRTVFELDAFGELAE
jgi:hypothetical protein